MNRIGRWIGAAVGILGILVLAAAYHFLWPHRRTATNGGGTPVRTALPSAPGSGGSKPSPLARAPVQTARANEHPLPAPGPLPAAPNVPQTPESLGRMIRALGGQPGAVVRVSKVKHEGGRGCEGTLVFTLNEIRFDCPDDARESFRIGRGEVGQVHKNGVQLWKPGRGKKLGRRYHFSMTGRSKDLVEGAFAEWMNLRAG